ncbi:MAG: hypothetical protein ABSD72_16285 [Terracidiphilus sp.]|jgi:hypothetical protein
MHETVELIKAIAELISALAWPCVAVYFLVRFHRQIASLLGELPNAVRRARSVHAPGVEIELNQIGAELPIAERQASMLSLQLPPVPAPNKTEEGV